MNLKQSLKINAEECRQQWAEKIRYLTTEEHYQEQKDQIGRVVIPYAFEAGVRFTFDFIQNKIDQQRGSLDFKDLKIMGLIKELTKQINGDESKGTLE